MDQTALKFIHRITYVFCLISSFAILFMMLLTSADVIGRTLFSRPIPGTFELSQYMLAVAILLSIAHAQQTKQHINVDFFTCRMSRKSRVAFNVFFTIIALGFFILLIWQGISESIFAMEVGKSSDILKIPEYPFEMLVAVGAFLICLEFIVNLVTDIRFLITGTNRGGK